MIVVGVGAFSFSVSLGHVGALLGLAVVLGARAVVDVRVGVEPDEAGASACGLGHVGG